MGTFITNLFNWKNGDWNYQFIRNRYIFVFVSLDDRNKIFVCSLLQNYSTFTVYVYFKQLLDFFFSDRNVRYRCFLDIIYSKWNFSNFVLFWFPDLHFIKEAIGRSYILLKNNTETVKKMSTIGNRSKWRDKVYLIQYHFNNIFAPKLLSLATLSLNEILDS